MKNKILGISTALVIGSSTAVVAQDDLAPFFDGISGMATQSGGIVSFSERNIGGDNSVEYTDLFISAPDGEVVIEAGWLKAVPSVETPGSITFTMSPEATVTINDRGFPAPIVLNIANQGLVISADGITSGQGAAVLNYSISADSLSVTADSAGNPFLRALNLNLVDFSETLSITMATMLVENEGGAAQGSLSYDLTTPEQDVMAGASDFVDLAHKMSFYIVDERRMPEYMSGALNAMFELSMGPATGSAKMSGNGLDMDYNGATEASALALSMQDGRFSYTQTGGAVEYAFKKFVIEGMPIPPFDMTAAGMDMEIMMPFSTGGAFEQAKVFMDLQDISVSETIWSMIDPGQVIARDPINMTIDVTANVKSNVDWSDPEAAFDSGNPMDIGEVQDVSINEISFNAAGAAVLAQGMATIDNSMGFPFPTGNVNITLNGIQGLANGLVELGLIPGEQVGMMMGMMMAFAAPGSQADEFTSNIEFSPNGVTANGTPLPF